VEVSFDFIRGILILYMLCCTAFNVSWWLYGKTLSENFPIFVVVTIMLTTLISSFFAFKFILEAICNSIFSPDWGYISNYVFIPYSKYIVLILSGLLTIGIAVLLYKDEGKFS